MQKGRYTEEQISYALRNVALAGRVSKVERSGWAVEASAQARHAEACRTCPARCRTASAQHRPWGLLMDHFIDRMRSERHQP